MVIGTLSAAINVADIYCCGSQVVVHGKKGDKTSMDESIIMALLQSIKREGFRRSKVVGSQERPEDMSVAEFIRLNSSIMLNNVAAARKHLANLRVQLNGKSLQRPIQATFDEIVQQGLLHCFQANKPQLCSMFLHFIPAAKAAGVLYADPAIFQKQHEPLQRLILQAAASQPELALHLVDKDPLKMLAQLVSRAITGTELDVDYRADTADKDLLVVTELFFLSVCDKRKAMASALMEHFPPDTRETLRVCANRLASHLFEDPLFLEASADIASRPMPRSTKPLDVFTVLVMQPGEARVVVEQFPPRSLSFGPSPSSALSINCEDMLMLPQWWLGEHLNAYHRAGRLNNGLPDSDGAYLDPTICARLSTRRVRDGAAFGKCFTLLHVVCSST